MTIPQQNPLYLFNLFIVFQAIESQSIGLSTKGAVTNTFHSQKG